MIIEKFVYIAFFNNEIGGVEKKILSQFNAVNVSAKKLILLVRDEVNLDWIYSTVSRGDVIVVKKGASRFPLIQRYFIYKGLNNQALILGNERTVFYFRFPGPDPFFAFLFRRLRRAGSIVVTEHQQIENPFRLGIYKLDYLFKGAMDLLFGKLIRKQVSCSVSVCQDIASYQKRYHGPKKNVFHLVMGNGIPDDVPMCKTRYPELNDSISICFIGGGYRTHGIHRLLKSYYNYLRDSGTGNKHNLIFHIVGDSGEMGYNRDLCRALGLGQNVIFHGHLPFSKYSNILSSCDLAMSTLSFSRVGLRSHSVLKSREYCAFGIPFFYAGIDEDFPSDFKYALRIEDNDLPFDFEALVSFRKSLSNNDDLRQEMHQYAIENLRWEIKMNQLLMRLANFSEMS